MMPVHFQLNPASGSYASTNSGVNASLIRSWEQWVQAAEPWERRDLALPVLMDCLEHNCSKLNLSNLLLTSLPDRLPPLLKELDVGGNRLTNLPELPNSLVLLNVGINKLQCLPDTLPPSLKELNVRWNKLITLPESLPDTLEVLHLEGNLELVALPETLPASLVTLSVSETTRLPENLPGSITLKIQGESFCSTYVKLSEDERRNIDQNLCWVEEMAEDIDTAYRVVESWEEGNEINHVYPLSVCWE